MRQVRLGRLAEKITESGAGGFRPGVRSTAGPRAPGQLEPFAEVPGFLVLHRLRPAFAALVGGAKIEVGAITAHAEVGPALGAGFAPAWLVAERPFGSAAMAVARHGETLPKMACG